MRALCVVPTITRTLALAPLALALIASGATAQGTLTPIQPRQRAYPGQLQPKPQQIPLSTIAQQAAGVFEEARVKKVAVLDFANSDSSTDDKIGQQLAADFRVQFDQAPHNFTIEDRATLLDVMKRFGATQDDLVYEKAVAYMLHESKIDAWAMGTLVTQGDTIALRLILYKVKDAAQLAIYETSVPFTDELRALVVHPPAALGPDPTVGVSGAHGYSMPHCDYCPAANYTDLGAKARLQGTVILVVTVSADGHASDVTVVKGLPMGLTQKAIDTVKTWRFTPATGPDGQPAAVRQTIEVSFHLY